MNLFKIPIFLKLKRKKMRGNFSFRIEDIVLQLFLI